MSDIKHLLPQVPRYFRANLHTHSTISDGDLTPEALKETYKNAGYSILSITDHNVLANHSYLNDPDFLTLTGTEINLNSKSYRPGFSGKVYHFNLISKTPDNLWYPGQPRRKWEAAKPYEDKMHFENLPQDYSIETANQIIDQSNKHGYLVMYNHPNWSGQWFPDYAPLRGLWGVEIRNSQCCRVGIDENNSRVYQDLLRLGNRIMPTGTDDTHGARSCFGAWTMIGAEKLEYDSVIQALIRGDLYMSNGPHIQALCLEGTTLRIICTEAQQILLESHGRFARRILPKNGKPLTEAEFDLSKWFDMGSTEENTYIRLTVTAPDGTYAVTRAYFREELV